MKATQRLFVALLGAWLLLRLPVALAIDSTPPLPDPVLQRRYLALTHELRCMQCQDESLADSPVGLASDLRRNVQEMLVAGASDEQVRDHMVARYGEFILFRPRMNWRNAWLWCAPAVLMLIGAIIAARVLRERSRRVDQEETDDESLNA
ncbi:MAG TPA: cytochrome c-type biogenesis protein [Steroidobacteraceae bacterium]|nr:cytochrome c-type biogenesis protein [Steroidobacteraceae bacterium]